MAGGMTYPVFDGPGGAFPVSPGWQPVYAATRTTTHAGNIVKSTFLSHDATTQTWFRAQGTEGTPVAIAGYCVDINDARFGQPKNGYLADTENGFVSVVPNGSSTGAKPLFLMTESATTYAASIAKALADTPAKVYVNLVNGSDTIVSSSGITYDVPNQVLDSASPNTSASGKYLQVVGLAQSPNNTAAPYTYVVQWV